MEQFINVIRREDELNHIPIKQLNRICKLLDYRISLWGYNKRYDPRKRNIVVMYKEN